MGLIVLLLGYYFLNSKFGLSISCPIHSLTGLHCPGCGLTRSIFSIIKLDFKSAFMYNQLVFCLLPFFLTYYSINGYYYIKGSDKKIRIPTWLSISILIIVLAFGILRNIPYFDFLRP